MVKGTVALITGGGSGVGRAAALALALDGCLVAVLGRRLEPLRETVALIEEAGGEGLAIVCDVGDEAAVAGAVDAVIRGWGGVDILVCAAGVGLYGSIESYSIDDWETTLRTNVTGVFLPVRAIIPSMRSRGGGAIIAIGSGAGKQGYATLGAYSASKFALLGLMQSVAAEVSDAGIKVSTVLPGSIMTEFGPTPFEQKQSQRATGRTYLEPADVAEAVRFLLAQSDRAWTQELNLWPF